MDFTIVNKITLFCAKRNSGKSVLLKWIVSQHKDEFRTIFVICPTEQVNKFYQKDNFVKKENIFSEYSDEWITKLVNKMTKMNEGRTEKAGNLINILLIMDDLGSDKNFHHCKTLKQLCVRGRHIGIGIVFTMQYPKHLPPVSRQNADFICAGQLNKSGLEDLCDEYTSCNLTTKEFLQMYGDSTKDYSFLLINNNSTKSSSPNEVYGRIKTPANFV